MFTVATEDSKFPAASERRDWLEHIGGDTVVVCLAGELDLSTVEMLHRHLMWAVGCGVAAKILLDFAEVTFVDACSIGEIVAACNAAEDDGRVLQVAGLHGMPLRVFEMLGLEKLKRATGQDMAQDPAAAPALPDGRMLCP